jgi:sortase A
MRRVLSRLPVFMVLLAALLLGDVVYEEYGSNIVAASRAASVRETLRSEWREVPSAVERPVTTAPAPSTPRRSKGFALLYVPRLRSTAWELPVLSGTSDRELNSGVGHHQDSALPWQDGNVVLSGHRTSYGRPFAEIEKLRVGDQVFLETRDAWYVYTLVDDAIVKSEALWVKDATPTPALAGESKVITLITCTPKGSVAKRWVWWGKLTEVRGKDAPPVGVLRQG